MAQARRKKSGTKPPLAHHVSRGLREGAFFVLLAISAYLLVSLLSYDPQDPGWSHSGPVDRIVNAGGVAGAWFADVSLYLIGYLAYLFPVMIGYSGWLLYKDRTSSGQRTNPPGPGEVSSTRGARRSRR